MSDVSESDSRRTDLINALSKEGWRVTGQIDSDVLGAWIEEIWTVQSIWSPRDFQIFIVWEWDHDNFGGLVRTIFGETFLEDPLTLVDRVYKPDFTDLRRGPVICLKHWPKELESFLEELSSIRDSAATKLL